jgi:hypothetical protein
MGMVLVHPENPGQDLQQATVCFRDILTRYPGSDLRTASRTWLALISQLEENRRTVEQLESKSAILNKQVKEEQDQRLRLEERLQQMKTIDLTVE